MAKQLTSCYFFDNYATVKKANNAKAPHHSIVRRFMNVVVKYTPSIKGTAQRGAANLNSDSISA